MHKDSLTTALTHPVSALQFLMGRRASLQDRIILAAARRLYRAAFDERRWIEALAELEAKDVIPPGFDVSVAGNSHQTTLGKWLYSAVRAVRPATMIETGVALGVSSWMILNAMEKNQHGRLLSIDLPDHDTHASYNVGARVGIAVPESLRHRWTLILEDSKSALPRLLDEVSQVDVFFHDSNHSYEFMQWEFATVFPFVAPGGLIISDDVQKNRAFAELVAGHALPAFTFNKGATARKVSGHA